MDDPIGYDLTFDSLSLHAPVPYAMSGPRVRRRFLDVYKNVLLFAFLPGMTEQKYH
jgi:hypothetical protein